MKILIYGINYSPELTGIGKYSGEMGGWFASRGHDVRVVTAPPYYPDWKILAPYKNRYATEYLDGVQVMRCPLYVPESLNTAKRIFHLASFAVSSLPRKLAQLFWKPDVVVCVVPSLFCVPVAWLTSRLVGARLVIHVQDYEVDAMLGLDMSGAGMVAKLARWFERVCLKRADALSTISNSMIDRAIAKGVNSQRTLLFPNWSEVDRFLTISDSSKKELRDRLELPTDKKLCLYSGNIGEKQGLENVLLAADAMRGESVEFLLVGQGAGLDVLKQKAKELSLLNLRFLPLQPWEDLPALLSLADCHLVIQRKGVADAVLPSKLTNIMAVGGQALITAERGTELANLCGEYSGISELIEPEDLDQLISGIRAVLAKTGFNEVAQDYARKNLDKDSVLKAFESAIN